MPPPSGRGGDRRRTSGAHARPTGKGVGYSGTPLVRKLGYKPGFRVALIGAPADYLELLGGLPAGVERCEADGLGLDLVHIFTKRRSEMEREIPRLRGAIAPAGMIWASWPKKSAGVPTDLTGDVIRAVALANDLVDVKVCAVDQTWSALKLVIPVVLR